ncbi:hypothetical protein CR194_18425 [Salipaludibacillus keqinensis]|uniref:YwdI family protein n=1 Tax=Salipaludibacillus keqinensis TaxID=2045207 RepID=A0A323T8F2_9BACI|nr:YwdI family protein [Salipaludibacillus keqinensis]PYZ91610.1 hypothetical protein CR194_18425 [Salipaludibacillus keqinensis]
MEIPAKLVVRKMEEELMKLKGSLDETTPNSYRDHAQALKTYCDLLLDSGSSHLQAPAKVQHASVDEVTRRMSEGFTDTKTKTESVQDRKKTPIYDEGDNPKSDSLFDF